jgi:hypothetical protein
MSGHFTHIQGERINTILPVATSATSTTYTLSKQQSGSIIFLNASNFDDGSILNLPPPDYGLNFKFVIVTLSNSQNIVNIKSVNSSFSSASLMYINTSIDGNNAGTTLRSNLAVDMDTGMTGADMFEFICDGTYWYVSGNVSLTSSYTSS